MTRKKEPMNLNDLLSRHGATDDAEVIPFSEYFERVQADPSLAQLAHARLYAMLTEQSPDGTAFFKDTIFGADAVIEAFSSIIKSSAKRHEIRKRIILLMGPPGAGKSTIAATIKRGIADYTKRHPLYAIAECPIHEEPLHLLTQPARDELAASSGIYIEGGLCPYCQVVVREKYEGRIGEVPVRRLSLSEATRIGVGTFEASDSKNQSVDDLVGSVNIAKITEFSEDDPRAYSYSGEILTANRGVLELVELFKANPELLWTFLSATQEQQVKLPRLPMCSVDVVMLAHTNQAEFEKFQSDPKNEALRDRIVPIKVPYTLAVSDEMKIYERLLKSGNLDGVHIPSRSLQVAAQFAVMSRLEESERLKSSEENKSGLIKKMKLYDGQSQTGFTDSDVKALHEESPNEGMDGAGPRQVINALSTGVTDHDVKCLTPITTIKAIKAMIKGNIQLSPARKKFLEDRLGVVGEMFQEDIKIDVQKGFVHGFADAGADMFERYIENVLAFLNEDKVKNPITDVDEEPNERFMRRIEEMVNVSETQARGFRTEIANKMGAALRAGRKFDFESHPALKEGIEKALFHDLKDAIAITTSQRQNPEARKRFNEVVESMTKLGWCPVCAEESINFVAQQL